MRSMLTVAFTTIFIVMLLQPMIEIYSVIAFKVELGAAILNSCRAARNYVLMENYYDDYYYDNIGDLNANIDDEKFREHFADAFSQTLDVYTVDDRSDPVRFDGNGRWNWIEVFIDWQDDTYYADDRIDYSALDGRTISTAFVRVETPYRFKTGLLSRLVASRGNYYDYYITEERTFIVNIIN